MNIRYLTALCLLLICFSLTSAYAQSSTGTGDSASLQELDRMVITGSRTERPMENLPASISSVNEKQIEQLAVDNVDEVLKYEQGIFNKRSKGLMESMAGVVIRGFAGTDQVLILLDGQPMNNGYVGRPQFNNIPVESIKKVEVARGPFSSLYGGNAMGGVVNIITRTPVAPKLTFRGGLGGRDDAGMMQNFYVGYEDAPIKDKLGVSLFFSRKGDEGYSTSDLVTSAGAGADGPAVSGVIPTTDRYGATKFIYGEGGENSAENQAVGGKLSWNINNDHSLKTGCYLSRYSYRNTPGISYLKDSAGTVLDTGYVTFDYDDTTYTFKLYQRKFLDGNGGQGFLYYTLSYNGQFSENVLLSASGGLTHQFENWYTSIGTSSASTRAGGPGKISITPNTKGNVDVHAEIRNLIPMNTLLAGVSIEGAQAHTEEYNLANWQRYTEEDRDTLMYEAGGKTANGGFFINDEFTIAETDGTLKNCILNAGFRIDYWRTMAGMNHDYVSGKVDNSYKSRSKTSFSPRGGLTLNLSAGNIYAPTFRIAGGKAFRPPTVYDLYRTWLSSTGTLNESNPDLKPETMWSGEVGMTHRFADELLTLDATAYYNTLTDMIYSTTVSDEDASQTVKRKMNIGKARMRGVETALKLRPWKNILLFGTYSFTDAYVVEMDEFPDQVDKYLTLVPRHTTGFGIQAQYGIFSGRIGSRYVSKRYTADDNSDTTDGVYGSRDPYFVTDCNVTVRPVKRCAFTFSVDNLFDVEYYDYYRAPGRTLSGSVKLEF